MRRQTYVCGVRVGITPWIFHSARLMAQMEALYHRARLTNAAALPKGPALLVGNHGLLGLETPAFFHLIHQHTGRIPVGLADRRVFGMRPIRALLESVGGVMGTVDNALTQLGRGQLVVCYPGGSREVFKDRDARYQLAWQRRFGFARIAIQAQVPIVPFAGLGVDDAFWHLGHLPGARRILGRYAAPVVVGLGVLPLPVQFHFILGRCIVPRRAIEEAPLLKAEVQSEVERLLEIHGNGTPEPA